MSAPALITASVGQTFVPALKAVLDELRRRHPKASEPQLVDMIVCQGILSLHCKLGLPVRDVEALQP